MPIDCNLYGKNLFRTTTKSTSEGAIEEQARSGADTMSFATGPTTTLAAYRRNGDLEVLGRPGSWVAAGSGGEEDRVRRSGFRSSCLLFLKHTQKLDVIDRITWQVGFIGSRVGESKKPGPSAAIEFIDFEVGNNDIAAMDRDRAADKPGAWAILWHGNHVRPLCRKIESIEGASDFVIRKLIPAERALGLEGESIDTALSPLSPYFLGADKTLRFVVDYFESKFVEHERALTEAFDRMQEIAQPLSWVGVPQAIDWDISHRELWAQHVLQFSRREGIHDEWVLLDRVRLTDALSDWAELVCGQKSRLADITTRFNLARKAADCLFRDFWALKLVSRNFFPAAHESRSMRGSCWQYET